MTVRRFAWRVGFYLLLCLTMFRPQAWGQPAATEVSPAPTVPGQAVDGADDASVDPEPSDVQTPDAQTPDDTLTTPAVDSIQPVDEEYFELLRLFADTLDQVERNYVKEVSRRELMEAAIQGVLAKLDEYSDYIAPDQLDTFRRGVENEFGGIGIRVGAIDGKLVVVTPLINTPAYRAGVLTGDEILRIGDVSAEGMALEDAINRMKGKIGSDIALTVRHEADGKEEQVVLTRELVRMETVFGDHRLPNDHWDFMYDGEKKIAYVRVSAFSRHTSEDLKEALDQLKAQGMKGLILDLRFNPGGLLSTAIEVADMFLSRGTIVSTAGRNTAERVWSAVEPGTYDGFEMVVLINGYSASASEIVAAALQDHGRAVVIGQRSWGKGSVQNIIELEGGRSALKLTTAGYQRPSGKNIHRFEGATDEDEWGVRPDDGFEVSLSPNEARRLLTYQRDRDILSSPTSTEQAAAEPFVDRQLQSGLDYLSQKLQAPAP